MSAVDIEYINPLCAESVNSHNLYSDYGCHFLLVKCGTDNENPPRACMVQGESGDGSQKIFKIGTEKCILICIWSSFRHSVSSWQYLFACVWKISKSRFFWHSLVLPINIKFEYWLHIDWTSQSSKTLRRQWGSTRRHVCVSDVVRTGCPRSGGEQEHLEKCFMNFRLNCHCM